MRESSPSTKIFCMQILKLCPRGTSDITKLHTNTLKSPKYHMAGRRDLGYALSGFLMSLRNALNSELQSYKNWVFFSVFAIFPPYLKKEKRKTCSTSNSMTKNKRNCKCSMAHAKSSRVYCREVEQKGRLVSILTPSFHLIFWKK